MSIKSKVLGALAVAGLSAAIAGSAQASIIATLQSVTPDGSPGVFNYTYGATLSADEQIVQGSFLTIYDFGPVVGGLPKSTTASPVDSVNYLAQFAFSQSLLGATPAQTAPVDNPAILNVTGTYNGSLGTVSGLTLGNGSDFNLGTFTLGSNNSGSTNAQQGSSAQKSTGATAGQPDVNVGPVDVPAPAATTVPEPASLALLGTALFGVGLLRRRKSG